MRRIAKPAIGDMDIMAIPEVDAHLVAAIDIDAVAANSYVMRICKADRRNGFMRLAKILGICIGNTNACQ